MLDVEWCRLDLLDREILRQWLGGECETVDERHGRCSSDRGTVVVGGSGARRMRGGWSMLEAGYSTLSVEC